MNKYRKKERKKAVAHFIKDMCTTVYHSTIHSNQSTIIWPTLCWLHAPDQVPPTTAAAAAEVPWRPSYGGKGTASGEALRERPLTAPRARRPSPSPPPCSTQGHPRSCSCPPLEQRAYNCKFLCAVRWF